MAINISPVTGLNISLYVLLTLLVVGFGAGSYYGYQALSAYNLDVNHRKIDGSLADQSISKLQILEKELDENESAVTKAAAIVSDTKFYRYQDQIVNDITAHAQASGINILGFDFSTANNTAAQSSVKGLKTVTATITLDSPLEYTKYLNFLKNIEKSLTKMQVTQINTTKDPKSTNEISAPSIAIEVYVP